MKINTRRIILSLLILSSYLILIITFGFHLNIKRIMIMTYSFLQLILCLIQKIKPMPVIKFNIIGIAIYIISLSPIFIFLFNQSIPITWENIVVISLNIFITHNLFERIKDDEQDLHSYQGICALTLLEVIV